MTRIKAPRHLSGLDTCRFVAAIWVALSHGLLPPIFPVMTILPLWVRLARGIYDCLFNGIAAVIVFFFISGLCIHLPNVGCNNLKPIAFLARRYVRIGIPLLIILACMQLVGGAAAQREHDVLWSLYCELIYYTFYPILFLLFTWIDIASVLTASVCLSVGLLLAYPQYGFFTLYGTPMAAAVCLPYWLLGCLLAQTIRKKGLAHLPGSIWLWRIGGWGYVSLELLMSFHLQRQFNYSLLFMPFGVFVYYWLQKEIVWHGASARRLRFEKLGRASYSIYIVHNMAIGMVSMLLAPHAAELWLAQLMAVILASWFFYLLVENPSHQLARRLAPARHVQEEQQGAA